MRLPELVGFAYSQWGEPKSEATLPTVGPENSDIDVRDDEEDLPPASRPQPPDWIPPTSDGGAVLEPSDSLEAVDEPDPENNSDGGIGGATSDTLAHYLPFHYFGRDRWGIYLKAQGIGSLAHAIRGPAKVKLKDALDVARSFLWEHEYFHAQAEWAATKLEVLSFDGSKRRPKPVYVPYFGAGATSIRAAREEAIANARALARVGRVVRGQPKSPGATLAPTLRAWCLRQGVGYRHFTVYEPRGGLTRGYRLCALSMCRALGVMPNDPRWPGAFLVRDTFPRSHDIPVRLVGPLPAWMRLVRPFQRWSGVEANLYVGHEHPPAHLHVRFDRSSGYRVCSWPELTVLKGKPLSASERKRLEAYVARFRDRIDSRAALVFGAAPTTTVRVG